MRRIGESVRPDTVYRDRPGVYGIMVRDGLLLCTRTDELQLPGGGIEPWESPLQALHREVYEETGWRIAGPDGGVPRRLTAFQRYAWLTDDLYWARKVQSIFVGRAVGRLGPPAEREHTPVWLTPFQALARLDIAVDRMAVARALRLGLIG